MKKRLFTPIFLFTNLQQILNQKDGCSLTVSHEQLNITEDKVEFILVSEVDLYPVKISYVAGSDFVELTRFLSKKNPHIRGSNFISEVRHSLVDMTNDRTISIREQIQFV